jgi:hypothetical protein
VTSRTLSMSTKDRNLIARTDGTVSPVHLRDSSTAAPAMPGYVTRQGVVTQLGQFQFTQLDHQPDSPEGHLWLGKCTRGQGL